MPRVLSVAVAPLALSLLGGMGCYQFAGPTLGLFLGGLLVMTVLVPPLVLAEGRVVDQVVVVAALVVPMSVVWVYGTARSEILLGECASCVGVLTAYAFALAGVAVGFRSLKCASVVSAGLSVMMGLAWLTWPVWLSRTWDGRASEAAVARLSALCPATVVDAKLVLTSGGWTGQSIAYHLTALQQDVTYAMPRHAWPCNSLHLSIGLGILGLAAYRRREEAPLGDGSAVSVQAS